MIIRVLLAAILCCTLTACIGSEKPRRVVRGQALDKPYVPPINPDLLVPAQLQRDDLIYKRNRAAIRAAVATPYINIHTARDEDIKRITTPKPKTKK